MNLQNNSHQSTSIKEEYLPPPLEKNYLSLLDIQVKMTKEFLTGSEEEKISTIKKRIKKFFDYGNDESEELNFGSSKKKNTTNIPFEIDKSKIKENLKLDCSKIILYGEESITFEVAEKMFSGFMGFQKIDDCNVRLSFSNSDECKTLLIRSANDKSSLTTDHIIDPYEIQWFELQNRSENYDQKQKQTRYYARFVTNKDNILFGNDKYFRKLLGKARDVIDKREQQDQLRQKEIQEKAEINKSIHERKRKFITKRFGQKKYKKDFDTQTNYDGIYWERTQRDFKNSHQSPFYRSREEPTFAGQSNRQVRRHFDQLDISAIRPGPIELESYADIRGSRSRQHHRSSSREQLDFSDTFQAKPMPIYRQMNPRDQMVRSYRERQFSNSATKGRFFLSDYQDYQGMRMEKRRY